MNENQTPLPPPRNLFYSYPATLAPPLHVSNFHRQKKGFTKQKGTLPMIPTQRSQPRVQCGVLAQYILKPTHDPPHHRSNTTMHLVLDSGMVNPCAKRFLHRLQHLQYEIVCHVYVITSSLPFNLRAPYWNRVGRGRDGKGNQIAVRSNNESSRKMRLSFTQTYSKSSSS